MQLAGPWREVCRCEDERRARMIATTLEAMEFDVRLVSLRDGLEVLHHDLAGDAPFAVQVDEASWAQIVEVIDELIEEQESFDEFLEHWRTAAAQREQRLLLTLAVIVGTLTTIGAIRL